MRRAPGEGSVEKLPSGRFRVRMRIPGRKGRHLPGTYATKDEAEQVRVAALVQLQQSGRSAVGALTLRAFGPVVIDRWQLRGNRSVSDDRNTFNAHIACAHFADWPIQNVRRVDVKRWRDEMLRKRAVRAVRVGKAGKRLVETDRPLSRMRIVNALSVMRRMFHEAAEDEVIDQNPAADVRVPSRPRSDDPWTFLQLEEQIAFLDAVPARDRPMVAFAIGTGLREGELYALKSADVDVDGEHPYVTVRYGGRDTPPKNGKIRRVALFGLALAAARAQIAHPPKKNRHNLMFPGERGGWRPEGKAPKGWRAWLTVAGVERRFRVHDMRHTCASALVSGMWGRAWSLEEVRDQLGHSDIRVTQRYAHLAGSALKLAAKATDGPRGGSGGLFFRGEVMNTNEFVNRRSRVQVSKAAPQLPEGRGPSMAQPVRGVKRAIRKAIELAIAGSETACHGEMRRALRLLGLPRPPAPPPSESDDDVMAPLRKVTCP